MSINAGTAMGYLDLDIKGFEKYKEEVENLTIEDYFSGEKEFIENGFVL